MKKIYTSPEKFAQIQQDLLQLEREAEVERTKDLLICGQQDNNIGNKKVIN
jgi:hypothetical protein